MKNRPEIICPSCNEKKKHRARGLCLHCYTEKYPRKKVVCLGCGILSEHKARNLCHNCYQKRYQDFPKLPWNLGRNADEILEALDRKRVVPAQATSAQPGTEEKIRVMIERHGRGELLHHEDDNRTPLRPPTLSHQPVPELELRSHKTPYWIVDTGGNDF